MASDISSRRGGRPQVVRRIRHPSSVISSLRLPTYPHVVVAGRRFSSVDVTPAPSSAIYGFRHIFTSWWPAAGCQAYTSPQLRHQQPTASDISSRRGSRSQVLKHRRHPSSVISNLWLPTYLHVVVAGRRLSGVYVTPAPSSAAYGFRHILTPW